jgi:RNA polymerase sigma factor (sigma-70 family)
MTTPSGPGGGRPDPGLNAIMGERRQLINLTYRLLGSLAEAEDAVQETYARWYALSRQQRDAIETPGAWLTTVASRICLNLLGSARARRETYVGEWIPEPLPERTGQLSSQPAAGADPADRVTLDESVGMAFLVVLESMTPAERVAFILHDVFRYSFAEVAEIVGRTPAACRQLASSARRRIGAARTPATPASQQAALVRDFKGAWEAKDIGAIVGLLDPDATAIADSGGLAVSFLDPIAGGTRLDRDRQPGARRHDVPGTHGQRPARSRGRAGRRRRDGVRVRRGRRPDQAHLGGAKPGEAPSVDDRLVPWQLTIPKEKRSGHHCDALPRRPYARSRPTRWPRCMPRTRSMRPLHRSRTPSQVRGPRGHPGRIRRDVECQPGRDRQRGYHGAAPDL